uniref:Serine protease n=1 Tax=Culicoides sonorensis TaxID=179676 RepID=A0A336MZF0_CULSO
MSGKIFIFLIINFNFILSQSNVTKSKYSNDKIVRVEQNKTTKNEVSNLKIANLSESNSNSTDQGYFKDIELRISQLLGENNSSIDENHDDDGDDDKEGPQRRIFNGQKETRNTVPYSSIISIRTSKNPFTIVCTGVLISPRLALTAAHCILEICTYYIGYGYLEVRKQHLIKVAHSHRLPALDVAHLQLQSDILLAVTFDFTYFNRLRWNLDAFDSYLKNQTFLCGYGAWEGKNVEEPVQTDQLRCMQFAFSVNMKVCFDGEFPGSMNDDRLLCSMNIDQVWIYDIPYVTSCFWDGGAPVFLYHNKDNIELIGIHRGGPKACGTGPSMEIATLMKEIEPYLTS